VLRPCLRVGHPGVFVAGDLRRDYVKRVALGRQLRSIDNLARHPSWLRERKRWNRDEKNKEL
jgi:hypothetical protein